MIHSVRFCELHFGKYNTIKHPYLSLKNGLEIELDECGIKFSYKNYRKKEE